MQTTSSPARKSPSDAHHDTPAIGYRVELADLHAHLYRVTLTIQAPSAHQRVSLPVWIPGSYMVREFSKHLQQLEAHQGRRVVNCVQLDKNSWDLTAEPGKPLVLRYVVYANDNSVRTAWLDSQRGFFNGTSLCLRVHGHETQPHALELVASRATASWSVATGLTSTDVDAAGFGHYLAADYDELVDCPFELGTFWHGEFKAAGIPHRFVVAGAPLSFDGARLLHDTQKICEEQIRFWHPPTDGAVKGSKPPHKRYVFMLNAVDDGYGGLEHRNSTALLCNRRDLPRRDEQAGESAQGPHTSRQSEGYTTLLGLISHEYFHTWNVKRLRPAEFARYAYDAEQYTQLLWFFEGFTSYYDDLMLHRCGLIDNAGYVKLLNKGINQVMQTPGRLLQSVAQSSMDAWVKYYRSDENTPNATVSYYTKGALVALCLDLSLRAEGKTTLDNVMRALWTRCGGGPMAEADLAAVLAELAGRPFDDELTAWVHGHDELPLQPLLEAHGVAVHEDAAQLAHRLGLRVSEANGIQVKIVLRGGAAELAGFSAGDEWLGVETEHDGWRLSRLDDLLFYTGRTRHVTALVARDKRLMRLRLEIPTTTDVRTWRLSVENAASTTQWLG
ncbi:M61 family metallopeptidase [Pseudorhodoferax sp. Leaf267]|uniref:M61 family metallopeptidase n=1 Tax=Pseudorhodoferax sp. Leaf267 TaxID=1736316 RepID=UPI00070160F8|nr:M61 family metallopeptidase [Pseudorhodoferax sp. Leaf267]KQP20625.1 peptidase M61 [Pseudorhodoferax sp. Leaf267]